MWEVEIRELTVIRIPEALELDEEPGNKANFSSCHNPNYCPAYYLKRFHL